MKQDLNFSSLEDTSNGILSNDDLRFFYYDVGLDTISGSSIIFEDDEEIKTLKDNRKLTIKAVDLNMMPSGFQDGCIYFIKDNCDKTEPESLFRHMRNAFAHYHIRHHGDFIFMNDYYDKKCAQMTMIGKIRCDDLMNLCNLYFKQREKLSENMKSL